MGLMDILNGMQNGPHGNRPTPQQNQTQSGGGLSPVMLALIGLLAYKGWKGGGIFGGGGQHNTQQQPPQQPQTPATQQGGGGGGGLSDILGNIFNTGGNATRNAAPNQPGGGGGLGGMLGGLLAGGAAGGLLNGGLNNVLNDLRRNGQGNTAQSWVNSGDNDPINPDDLAHALGADTINQLSDQSGLTRNELLQGLAQHLPNFVDQLTPNGRLPTNDEANRW